jgi:putative transposase
VRKVIDRLFVHVVWATRRRLPLILVEDEALIRAVLVAKSQEFCCEAIAVGFAADHVHVLLRADTRSSISSVVGALKGASAFVFNKRTRSRVLLWQAGFAAITVSPKDLETVVGYVSDQRAKHERDALDENLELPLASPLNREPIE